MPNDTEGRDDLNTVSPEDIEVREVERRSFLRVAAIGLAGFAVAACGSEPSSSDDCDDDPTDSCDED